MANMLELERLRCLWPGCFCFATHRVFGNDGSDDGEFCRRHAKTMVTRLDRGEEVEFDYQKGTVYDGATA